MRFASYVSIDNQSFHYCVDDDTMVLASPQTALLLERTECEPGSEPTCDGQDVMKCSLTGERFVSDTCVGDMSCFEGECLLVCEAGAAYCEAGQAFECIDGVRHASDDGAPCPADTACLEPDGCVQAEAWELGGDWTFATSYVSPAFVGNLIQMKQAATLLQIQERLDVTGWPKIDWFVFETESETGPFKQIWTASTETDADDDGYVSAPSLALPLEADKMYLIGAWLPEGIEFMLGLSGAKDLPYARRVASIPLQQSPPEMFSLEPSEPDEVSLIQTLRFSLTP